MCEMSSGSDSAVPLIDVKSEAFSPVWSHYNRESIFKYRLSWLYQPFSVPQPVAAGPHIQTAQLTFNPTALDSRLSRAVGSWHQNCG